MTKDTHNPIQHSVFNVLSNILQSPLVQEQAGLALAEAAQGIQLISRMINQFLSSSSDGNRNIASDMSDAFTSLSKQLRHLSTPDPSNVLNDVIRSLDAELATLKNRRGKAVEYQKEAIQAVRDILSRHIDPVSPSAASKQTKRPRAKTKRSSRSKK